jgi:hypothetical protein
MELLDFNNWTSVFESSDLKMITKVFTFSPDFKKEVDDEYYRIADSLLKEDAASFEYTLTSHENNGSIEVSFGEEEDEFRSSIFGAPESFTITLDSLTRHTLYYSGVYLLNPERILQLFEARRKSSRLEKEGGSTIIKLNVWNQEFEQTLQNIAMCIAISKSYASSELVRPTSNDYDNALRYASNDKGGSGPNPIKELSTKLNEIIRYRTVLSILHKISSDYIVDIDKLNSDIYGRVNEFKLIDLSKLSDEDRKLKVDEILKFLAYLLKLADSIQSNESELVTDALVDIFRILLTQYDNVLEIKKELGRISKER